MATTRLLLPFRLLLIGIACILARAQSGAVEPYDALQTYPLYNSSEGTFTWPSGSTAVFDEGSSMTVTWTTGFDSVNLYVVYNQTVGLGIQAQRQLATNYAEQTYDWTVSCAPDCRAPFSFHAVNGQGTEDEQLLYGFWTRPFWIRPAGGSTSSASLPATSSSATAAPTTNRAAEATPSTAGSAGDSSADDNNNNNNSDDGDDSDDSGTAIGAGVGAGVGVVLLVGALVFAWRRYHRRMKAKYSGAQYEQARASWPQPASEYPPQQQQQAPTASSILSEPKPSTPFEPAEAPAWQVDPQELPGRHPY